MGASGRYCGEKKTLVRVLMQAGALTISLSIPCVIADSVRRVCRRLLREHDKAGYDFTN